MASDSEAHYHPVESSVMRHEGLVHLELNGELYVLSHLEAVTLLRQLRIALGEPVGRPREDARRGRGRLGRKTRL